MDENAEPKEVSADAAAVERVARAIVGDERYEALPRRATYLQRKSSSAEEWYDREGVEETARDAIKAYLAVV